MTPAAHPRRPSLLCGPGDDVTVVVTGTITLPASTITDDLRRALRAYDDWPCLAFFACDRAARIVRAHETSTLDALVASLSNQLSLLSIQVVLDSPDGLLVRDTPPVLTAEPGDGVTVLPPLGLLDLMTTPDVSALAAARRLLAALDLPAEPPLQVRHVIHTPETTRVVVVARLPESPTGFHAAAIDEVDEISVCLYEMLAPQYV